MYYISYTFNLKASNLHRLFHAFSLKYSYILYLQYTITIKALDFQCR